MYHSENLAAPASRRLGRAGLEDVLQPWVRHFLSLFV